MVEAGIGASDKKVPRWLSDVFPDDPVVSYERIGVITRITFESGDILYSESDWSGELLEAICYWVKAKVGVNICGKVKWVMWPVAVFSKKITGVIGKVFTDNRFKDMDDIEWHPDIKKK